MKQTLRIFSLLTLLSLGACYRQMGNMPLSQSYLEKHALKPSKTGKNTSFEEALANAAKTQPTIKFPARIGLVRLGFKEYYHSGYPDITTIPPAEMDQWLALRDKSGGRYGEFDVIDPAITNISASATPLEQQKESFDSLQKIRLAAAQKHLDAILLYELNHQTDNIDHSPWLLDLITLGLLPTDETITQVTAVAILIDVKTGYAYASTNTITAQKNAYYSNINPSKELYESASIDAVKKLSPEIEKMFQSLYEQQARGR
jgi:hypothetical protein